MNSCVKVLNVATVGVLVLMTLVIAAFACAGFVFTHPLADDFCRHANVHELGLWGGVAFEYATFTGRWLSISSAELLQLLFDPTQMRSYPFFVGGLNAFFCFAIGFLIHTLLGSPKKLGGTLLGTALFMAFYWATIPSPGGPFYWLGSATEYHTSNALFILVIALLIRKSPAQGSKPFGLFGVLFIGALCICAAGLHELFALMAGALIFVGLLMVFYFRHPRRFDWLKVFGLLLIGVAIIVLAPGNGGRSDSFTDVWNWGLALELTTLRVIEFYPLWLSKPGLWLLSFLLFLKQRTNPFKLGWVQRHPQLWRFFIPVLWVLMMLCGFYLPSLANGRPVYMRVVDIIYLVFIGGWFLNLLVWTDLMKAPRAPKPVLDSILFCVVSVLLAGSLVFTSQNMKASYHDLTAWDYQDFDKAMQMRYAYIRSEVAKGNKNISVPEILTWPWIYFHTDMMEDSNYWLNQCQARFFGAETLTLQKRG